MKKFVITIIFVTISLFTSAMVNPNQPTFSDSIFAKIYSIFCSDYDFLRPLHLRSSDFAITQRDSQLILTDSADYCRQNFCIYDYRTGEYYHNGLNFSFNRKFGIYLICPLRLSHGGELLIFIENGDVEIHPQYGDLLYVVRKLMLFMEDNDEIVTGEEFKSIISHLSGLKTIRSARFLIPRHTEEHQFKIFLKK